MITIKEVSSSTEKMAIADCILRNLPEWFGIESSLREYVELASESPFFAAYHDSNPVGFVAIRVHNPISAEIFVMGIHKENHRQGIGRKLIEHCINYSIDKKIEYLSVKTLDESREDESYRQTRMFYQSVGFKPLEVLPTLWGEENPCLLMIMYLSNKQSVENPINLELNNIDG